MPFWDLTSETLTIFPLNVSCKAYRTKDIQGEPRHIALQRRYALFSGIPVCQHSPNLHDGLIPNATMALVIKRSSCDLSIGASFFAFGGGKCWAIYVQSSQHFDRFYELGSAGRELVNDFRFAGPNNIAARRYKCEGIMADFSKGLMAPIPNLRENRKSVCETVKNVRIEDSFPGLLTIAKVLSKFPEVCVVEVKPNLALSSTRLLLNIHLKC